MVALREMLHTAEYGVTVRGVHALAGGMPIIRLWAPILATAAAGPYAARWLAVEQHFVAAPGITAPLIPGGWSRSREIFGMCG